ncbi:hypothetical protein [Pseudomonas sp. StFLB209]|uniref:hypothetical protein n=1 Tax=Pseudomonas sp. StFLB209 TaxID=1028989 RepID=UPI001185DDFD|nr:hypothetical protein [Pseudomonas sp. StFLB209]
MLAEPAAPATDRQPWQSAANVVSDTLRIPLAARALGDALFAQVAVNDLHARQALPSCREKPLPSGGG